MYLRHSYWEVSLSTEDSNDVIHPHFHCCVIYCFFLRFMYTAVHCCEMCCKDYSCAGLWPYREINILLLHNTPISMRGGGGSGGWGWGGGGRGGGGVGGWGDGGWGVGGVGVKLRTLRFSLWINYTSFNVWLRYSSFHEISIFCPKWRRRVARSQGCVDLGHSPQTSPWHISNSTQSKEIYRRG